MGKIILTFCVFLLVNCTSQYEFTEISDSDALNTKSASGNEDGLPPGDPPGGNPPGDPPGDPPLHGSCGIGNWNLDGNVGPIAETTSIIHEFNGQLYAGTQATGQIYLRTGNGSWILDEQLPGIGTLNVNDFYYGIDYKLVALSDKLYRKQGIGNWTLIYTIQSPQIFTSLYFATGSIFAGTSCAGGNFYSRIFRSDDNGVSFPFIKGINSGGSIGGMLYKDGYMYITTKTEEVGNPTQCQGYAFKDTSPWNLQISIDTLCGANTTAGPILVLNNNTDLITGSNACVWGGIDSGLCFTLSLNGNTFTPFRGLISNLYFKAKAMTKLNNKFYAGAELPGGPSIFESSDGVNNWTAAGNFNYTVTSLEKFGDSLYLGFKNSPDIYKCTP